MSERRTIRNEWKYQITPRHAVLLTARLNALLTRDVHAGPDGYLIRSLYFDDVYESAFYDKLAGVSERVKYRLRYYGDAADILFFERKRKHGIFIEKDSNPIDRTLAERMMRDEPLGMEALFDPLLAEYSALRSSRLLRPRVIVEYQRKAFTYPEQNVRITLDFNIRSGLYRTGAFFDRQVTLPVTDQGGVILEVKFDRYLPKLPKEALSRISLTPQANSKFCMSVLPMI